MKAGDCKHYNGMMQPGVAHGEERCKAGVNYVQLAGGSTGMALRLPCTQSEYLRTRREQTGDQLVTCTRFDAVTAEEEAADKARFEETLKTIAQDLSPCCKAPINRGALARGGRHKGSGWLFCSSCRRAFMHVCARGEP